MRQHADDALPGRLFFFAQRLAQVGDDDEVMRPAVAIEDGAPDLVAAAPAAERAIDEPAGSPVRYSSNPSAEAGRADELVAASSRPAARRPC